MIFASAKFCAAAKNEKSSAARHEKLQIILKISQICKVKKWSKKCFKIQIWTRFWLNFAKKILQTSTATCWILVKILGNFTKNAKYISKILIKIKNDFDWFFAYTFCKFIFKIAKKRSKKLIKMLILINFLLRKCR